MSWGLAFRSAVNAHSNARVLGSRELLSQARPGGRLALGPQLFRHHQADVCLLGSLLDDGALCHSCSPLDCTFSTQLARGGSLALGWHYWTVERTATRFQPGWLPAVLPCTLQIGDSTVGNLLIADRYIRQAVCSHRCT